jgi:hypothetical protein
VPLVSGDDLEMLGAEGLALVRAIAREIPRFTWAFLGPMSRKAGISTEYRANG